MNCSICWEEVLGHASKVPAALRKCGHVFHRSCVSSWLSAKSQCPECRAKNTRSDVIRLFLHNDGDGAAAEAAGDSNLSGSAASAHSAPGNAAAAAEILELKKALAKAESRGRSQTAQLGMLSESLKDAVAQTDILKKRAALHVQKLTAALDAHSAACRNIEILTPQLLQRDSELLAAKERIRELEQRNAELRSKDLTKVKEALKEYAESADLDKLIAHSGGKEGASVANLDPGKLNELLHRQNVVLKKRSQDFRTAQHNLDVLRNRFDKLKKQSALHAKTVRSLEVKLSSAKERARLETRLRVKFQQQVQASQLSAQQPPTASPGKRPPPPLRMPLKRRACFREMVSSAGASAGPAQEDQASFVSVGGTSSQLHSRHGRVIGRHQILARKTEGQTPSSRHAPVKHDQSSRLGTMLGACVKHITEASSAVHANRRARGVKPVCAGRPPMIAPSTVESSGTQFGRSVSVVRDAAYSAAKAAVSAKIAAKDQARKQHGALFFQRSRVIQNSIRKGKKKRDVQAATHTASVVGKQFTTRSATTHNNPFEVIDLLS